MDQDPQTQDPNSGAGNIDLSNILLPKKDAPSVDSAQRVDASTLLAQEQNATLIKPPQDVSIGSNEPRERLASASAAAGGSSTQTPANPDAVRPLQTFQGDIAQVVREGNMSMVSIAAKEATRRGGEAIALDNQLHPADETPVWRKALFLALGVVLLGGAAGLMVYAFIFRPGPLPYTMPGQSPFITVDSVVPVMLPPIATRNTAMQALVAGKNSVSLSLGLVAQLYVQVPATTTDGAPSYATAQTLFSTLAPDMPEALLRNVFPIYMLGAHSLGKNQPFLLFKVESYEQGYAGMLQWENSMKQDLSPLFAYTPPPKIAHVVQQPVATTSATTTSSTASSTDAALPLPFIQTGFSDEIVANHTARVLKTQDGQVNFLWTFLDRQTILITTNEETARAVLVRLTQAPIVSLPQ